jgi:HK97 family phage portal protein
MPVLRRMVGRLATARAVSLNPEYGPRWDLTELAKSLATGDWVTPEKALTLSAVWRSVSIISNVSAVMPLHTYEETEAGRRKMKRPDERFLWGRPNPDVNRFVFWQTVFLHVSLNGNAFIYVVPAAGRERRPAELWPLEPKRVKVGRDKEGRKIYEIDGTTPARDWTAGGELVHVQGLGTDGLRGLSPISLFAQSIGLGLAAQEYAARFYSQGSPPGGYLSSEQELEPDTAQRLSEMWEKHHQALGNAHRVAVLGHGTKWNTTTLNPEDAQLLATRQFQVADVSRMFGIPEHLLGSHDKQSSWGTGISEQNRGLLIYTVDPYLVNVELTISDTLQGEGRYSKFAREGLLRGTPTERAQFYKSMVEAGVFTPNIILELEDMETIGPEGDIRLRPANFVPLGTPAPVQGGTPAS